MSNFGLTTAGLVIKRLADIKLELQAAYQSAFGPAINIDERSPLGQIIGIHSEREADIWELLEAIYNSRYPDTATGLSLDNVATITNVTRLAATYSQGSITITGASGTVIPSTFQVSVVGNAASVFQVTSGGTIPGGGTLTLPVQATSTGPVSAPAGTLTNIVTPVSGVTSTTNAADVVVGRNAETDDALRLRRIEALNRPGTATVNGIVNALLNVTNVTQAAVIENDTDATDAGGRPPHSIEPVVVGGSNADIAAAILASKAAGIQTYGTITEAVADSQGIIHSISFSQPTEVEVYLNITITPNTDPNQGDVYPSNGDDAVTAAIVAYTGATGVLGRDVVLSQLYTPINTVSGVFGVVIEVSTDGATWQSTNLVLSADEVAVFATTRITVAS